MDEEYVACLLDAILEPEDPLSPTVLLERDGSGEQIALRERLSRARLEVDGRITHQVEDSRVRNIVVRLARAHAAYELHEPQFGSPHVVEFAPLAQLTRRQADLFEEVPSMKVWPEIGSRAFVRMALDGKSDWIVVQPTRYRYQATATDRGVLVRIVLRDYLAAEVAWL
jgi:hypothetical protein